MREVILTARDFALTFLVVGAAMTLGGSFILAEWWSPFGGIGERLLLLYFAGAYSIFRCAMRRLP